MSPTPFRDVVMTGYSGLFTHGQWAVGFLRVFVSRNSFQAGVARQDSLKLPVPRPLLDVTQRRHAQQPRLLKFVLIRSCDAIQACSVRLPNERAGGVSARPESCCIDDAAIFVAANACEGTAITTTTALTRRYRVRWLMNCALDLRCRFLTCARSTVHIAASGMRVLRYSSICSRSAVKAAASPGIVHAQFLKRKLSMSRPRFCIVSDLDHTLVDHSDHCFPTLLEFDRLWLSKFAHDSKLVFSTGRSLASYSELRKTVPLLTPDLLICSVGTEIYQDIDDELVLDSEWLQVLDEGWDRGKISSLVSDEFSQLKPQEESEQRPHKVSYHLQKDGLDDETAFIKRVQDKIHQEGLSVKVVYSGGVDVDILPEKASKGLALRFLQVRSI